MGTARKKQLAPIMLQQSAYAENHEKKFAPFSPRVKDGEENFKTNRHESPKIPLPKMTLQTVRYRTKQ